MTHHITTATLAAIFTAAALAGAHGAKAQSVSCDATDVNVCDKTEGQYLTLNFKDLRNLPAGYNDITVKYHNSVRPNEQLTANKDAASLLNDMGVWRIPVESRSLGDFAGGTEAGHADMTVTIDMVEAKKSNLERVTMAFDGPVSATWHIFGTPVADASLPASDPRRLALDTPSRLCGYETELSVADAWADVSSYSWATSSDHFTLSADGAKASVSTPRYADGHYSTQPKTTTITVVKTVGGTCSATFTKELTLLGRPAGRIGRREDAYGGEVRICTSLPEDEDPERYFDGEVGLDGVAPFTVVLSTQDKYTFNAEGFHKFTKAKATGAGLVTLAQVIDANLCPATADDLRGAISVTDRKPRPEFATDTIEADSPRVELSVTPSNPRDRFEWGLLPQSDGLDASISGLGEAATAQSNMNGPVDYYVVETDLDGVECASDTARLVVTYAMPLRYPNGFSPNGDGKNDRLVIEGLPRENKITVVDSRGKKVFEANNYRNDWRAEGVDDGYYVYIFKGRGTKTVKETLAIKRTK